MHTLSVWSVRAALAYLGLGFTFGAIMLSSHRPFRCEHEAASATCGNPANRMDGPARFWCRILDTSTASRTQPRGNERLAWVSLAS